jgi:hypothetical protein
MHITLPTQILDNYEMKCKEAAGLTRMSAQTAGKLSLAGPSY